MNYSSLLEMAIQAAESASKEILEVYHANDFQTEAKGDNSPLTIADKRAHEAIISILDKTNFPILSEEGKDIPYAVRKHWECFWMVDPLDGTKEFIKKNGEFTVNIALIENGQATLGVVAVPVSGEVFCGSPDQGAFVQKADNITPLQRAKKIDLKSPGLRVVASRSHMNAKTLEFLEKLNEPVLVSSGSSLKFMLIAKGEADLYPRFAPTMEWDTAAAHAIMRMLGFRVLKENTELSLTYNKENLLNPGFLVLGT